MCLYGRKDYFMFEDEKSAKQHYYKLGNNRETVNHSQLWSRLPVKRRFGIFLGEYFTESILKRECACFDWLAYLSISWSTFPSLFIPSSIFSSVGWVKFSLMVLSPFPLG